MNQRILSEEELIKKLIEDVDHSGKEKLLIQAGHFPLVYTEEETYENIYEWGQFSPYSLELGCSIGEYARSVGKRVRFAFFVDDHMYERIVCHSLSIQRFKTLRKQFYTQKSGPLASLHPIYKEIMQRHGFDVSDVVRQDQGKAGRRDCLYFSEKALRSLGGDIKNDCAREYVNFIEDPRYFNKETNSLISFVPQICVNHICDVALDQEIEGLCASHVFIETMDLLASRRELFTQGRGVTYRRD